MLLVVDKFMPEVHLKQPGFTYTACGQFTKNKERIEKLLAHLVSRFACNTRMIVDASSSPPVSHVI